MGKLYLLNALIMPVELGEGQSAMFVATKIDKTFARALARAHDKEDIVSAIGHEATAKILSEILGIEVKTNRIAVSMERGDFAIVCKVKKRLAEGEVLKELKDEDIELYFVARVY